ncbi:MAG TPA: nitroreductase [Thermoanaerobaculia bacterium]|nr:nitroreductase [Thermoanaerobaculia bacterium]
MIDDYDPRSTPWQIDEAEFHEIDDARAQKEFLLRYAVLAPSGHNTQPWTFRIARDQIEIYADYSRRLPVADPTDRELHMSIGAAITNLRVAAAHFGFESTVFYPLDHGPVAVIALRETCDADPQLRALFPAITRRHTNRADFDRREIEPEALERVCDIVESSELMRFVLPHDRMHAAELVEQADHLLMADETWRRELSEWVRPNDGSACDGMCGDAFGIPGPLSAFASSLIASFDVGTVRGRHDRELTENAAGLIVVTSDDDRVSLLRAGETLERLLLTLTLLDVQYSFLNQPVEVPQLRRELWRLVRSPRQPQLLLRIGYAKPVQRAMPRRPVETVLA